MTAITRGTRSVFLQSLCELLRAPSAKEAGHGCSSAALLPAGSGFPKVPCLQIPHYADNIAVVVSDFHVMQGCASPRDCLAPRVTTAPTTASVCWDQANLCVNYIWRVGKWRLSRERLLLVYSKPIYTDTQKQLATGCEPYSDGYRSISTQTGGKQSNLTLTSTNGYKTSEFSQFSTPRCLQTCHVLARTLHVQHR